MRKIFAKKAPQSGKDQKSQTDPDERAKVKFEKPKILTIDVADEVFHALEEVGLNVSRGTFGSPYKVPKGSGYTALVAEPRLPNYSEQEIVVVDLALEIANAPQGEKLVPSAELDWWCKQKLGFVDPRCRAASWVRSDFDRTYDLGGVFVIFAAPKSGLEIVEARVDRFDEISAEQQIRLDEWGFLSVLDRLRVSAKSGDEISVHKSDASICRLLTAHLDGATYDCVMQDRWGGNDEWISLAVNKFNEPVCMARKSKEGGLVLILPQLSDKAKFIKSLFSEVLPELSPKLFPNIERGRWTHLEEYEHPRVLELNNDRKSIEDRYRNDLTKIDAEIASVREQNEWIHELVTQTGDPLVNAIKNGLKILGFRKVVDMDEIRDKENKTRREDLRIEDASPTLIVDIKGVSNFASDEDVMQASKHATLAMKEMARFDMFGLSIINHQRHLPPLDRDNKMPFRQELLDLAIETELGLLTAWDFYRLVRNAMKHGWSFANVRPMLYRWGRIEIIPEHYSYIGKVQKIWSGKFGVEIESGSLTVGDLIAIESSILFEECEVQSMMVNSLAVDAASVGDPVGLPWPVNLMKLKQGMRVFRANK